MCFETEDGGIFRGIYGGDVPNDHESLWGFHRGTAG